MAKLLDLKEILSELASTTGRASLLAHIENLDGNIDATPEPEKPGEAEQIAAQMAELQKRADELAAAKPDESTAKPEGGTELWHSLSLSNSGVAWPWESLFSGFTRPNSRAWVRRGVAVRD